MVIVVRSEPDTAESFILCKSSEDQRAGSNYEETQFSGQYVVADHSDGGP